MKHLLIATVFVAAPGVLAAEDVPYVFGPDGGLHRGIDPDVFLEGSAIPRDGTLEWCFWPIGCWGNGELVPIKPGPDFDSQAYMMYQFENIQNEPDMRIELLPIAPQDVPMHAF